jgi:O-acetyl-ADP-ribose deacetylase (regulator of RNase III)
VDAVRVGNTLIAALQGDLTRLQLDAVVNAANEHLAHGGGLAAVIVRAGGREIQDQSDRWVTEHGPLRPGVAAVTTAGTLPAKFVVHVAGPRYHQGLDNEHLLRMAVGAALDAAVLAGCRSVGMPALSAGIFGYPLREATRVIADECVQWAGAHPGSLDEIELVGYDAPATTQFEAGLATAQGPGGPAGPAGSTIPPNSE